MKAILFVCTGNICRSVTAEGVMRHYLDQSQLQDDVMVDSAGLSGYHVGEPPDRRSIVAARHRGCDIADLVARQFIRDDFDQFDLILAMDKGHYNELMAMKPKDSRAQVSLFLDEQEVPDPYYGSRSDFEDVLNLVEEGADQLIKKLLER